MTAAAAPARRDTLVGMAFMTAGGFLLTTQDAIGKWLTSDYHAGEIMAYRGIFMLLPVMAAMWWQQDASFLRPRRPLAVGMRTLFTVLTSAFVVLSFMIMPLADALAVIFLSPLLVTALSVPLLGEAVGWRRWAAVLAGFAGVLMITSPEGIAFSWLILIPLTAALGGAMRDVITRRIGTTDSTLCVLFWAVFMTALAGFATLPFGTHWPSLFDWSLFAAAGVLGGASHFLTTRAFQIAPAAVMAPFKYLSLVWGAGFGYLLWGDVPTPMKLAGAGLMVASGLYVMQRERKLARQGRAGRP